jgi:hypothetical protein
MKTFLFFLKYILIISLLFSFYNCENQEITTGLEGHVYRSPVNPVEIEGQINYAPFSALFHVYNIDENRIESFTSSTDGSFKVMLLPGNYIIIPDKTAPLMGAQFQIKEVKIVAIGITNLDLNFDTGIR